MSDETIANAIRRHLTMSGTSQAELSAKIGRSPANISAICTGRRQCGIKLARIIADALGMKDGQRASFLNLVAMPKQKGQQSFPFSNERILAETATRKLKALGIGMESVASIVPTDGINYIIQKDGTIYELEMCVKKVGIAN